VVETAFEDETADVPVTIPENMEHVSAEPAKTFTAEHVGQLGAQDTYYVGSFEGIGEIYQQTYVDVYSNMAFVKLYTQKDSQAAVDMLENVVLPWFKRHDVVIEQVMTDRGREYTGAGHQKNHQQKNHPYQMALASSGIEHVKNGSNDPQSNAICTPFHQMVRALVYKKALRKGKKKSVSLQALQRSVDKWLMGYNSEHLHRLEGQRPLGSSNGEHGAEVQSSPQAASD
jgi:transposase InsO family protein